MIFNVKKNGAVHSGTIHLTHSDAGDCYSFHYSVKIRMGTKILGKNYSFEGTKDIPKNIVSRDYLLNTNNFTYDGVEFNRQSACAFTMKSSRFSGEIYFHFGGDSDPAECIGGYVDAVGQRVEFSP